MVSRNTFNLVDVRNSGENVKQDYEWLCTQILCKLKDYLSTLSCCWVVTKSSRINKGKNLISIPTRVQKPPRKREEIVFSTKNKRKEK